MDLNDVARQLWNVVAVNSSWRTFLGPLTTQFDSGTRITPMTSLQLAVGGALTVTSTIGLTRLTLFHPWLVGWPGKSGIMPSAVSSLHPNATNFWGWPRVLMAFFVLGPNLTDTLRRMYTIWRYGGAVEKSLYHPQPVGQTLISRPMSPWLIKARNWVSGLRPAFNPYVKLQLVTLAAVLAIEFLTTPGQPNPQQVKGFAENWLKQVARNSYALTPILEYATLFTWAGMSPTLIRFGSWSASTDNVTIDSFSTLPPLLVPLGICASGFFTTWKDMVKGLIASLVAAKVCGLTREPSAPGEPREVYSWMMKEWVGLLRWVRHWVGQVFQAP